MSSKKTLQFPFPSNSGLGRYFKVTLRRVLLLKSKIIIKGDQREKKNIEYGVIGDGKVLLRR